MKTLKFISTHIINKAVISEYKKLNGDGILAIDNTNLKFKPATDSNITELEFFGTKVKCFLFDKSTHDKLKLPSFCSNRLTSKFAEIMWYNADYRFYYVRQAFPDYDYYWQLDYDIFCNGSSYNHFFNQYSNDEDLLIIAYRKAQKNSDWNWTCNIDWIYDDNTKLYGSLFPICRLSKKAIDFLQQKRMEQGTIYQNLKNKKHTKWLNCEIFVPTELTNNGFKCAKINEPNITFDNEYDLNEDRLFETPDNKLYHPVKGDFINRLSALKSSRRRLKLNILGIKIGIRVPAKWF